jgi:hypothetical protein
MLSSFLVCVKITALACSCVLMAMSTATQEISRNVQQTAPGTVQASTSIIDDGSGTSETGSASSQVSVTQLLSSESARLKLGAGKFLGMACVA